MSKLFCFISNIVLLCICFPSYLRFRRSTKNVEKIQKSILMKIVQRNKTTRIGRKYNFETIESINDFRSRVPVLTYTDYLPYISRIEKGAKNILTTDKIDSLQPSSGSTSASKYIPLTTSLCRQFQTGVRSWFFNLLWSRKDLIPGNYYFAITPVMIFQKATDGGIRIGFVPDNDYFGFFERIILKRLLVVPEEVAEIQDMDCFRYITLLFLVRNRNLTFLSIWNPTFLVLLLKDIKIHLPYIIEDIRNGTIQASKDLDINIKKKVGDKHCKNKKRADELENIINICSGRSLCEGIWPHLKIISCWADGYASHYIGDLQRIFPNVEIQPKGLLATEGFVSFPLYGKQGSVLSINSHFFEFIEESPTNANYNRNRAGTTKLSHELEKGKQYKVIITTGGGLYRYDINDIIEVVGFEGNVPLIRFIGKHDCVLDMVGEKLNSVHVESILKDAFKQYSVFPDFFMMAPEKSQSGSCFYTLFIQGKDIRTDKLLKVRSRIERHLCENFHYDYCRRLGQLEGLKIFHIRNSRQSPAEVYIKRMNEKGRQLGTIKHQVLEKTPGWSKIFKGAFI